MLNFAAKLVQQIDTDLVWVHKFVSYFNTLSNYCIIAAVIIFYLLFDAIVVVAVVVVIRRKGTFSQL